MTKKVKAYPKYLLHLAAVMAVSTFLSACNTNGPGPGPGPDPTPSPAYRALVDEPADGPVFDLIQQQAEIEQNDGSQDLADYDLLIVDGDHQTPEDIAGNESVQKALATNTWVLVLDATYAHKKEGILPHIGFGTKGDTEAFLFRKLPDTRIPEYHFTELPPDGVLNGSTGPELPTPSFVSGHTISGQQRDDIQQARRQEFTSKLGDTIDNNGPVPCSLSPQPLDPNVIAVFWCQFSQNTTWSANNTNYVTASSTVPAQTGTFQPVFGFTLMLQNEASVAGDFQQLYVQAEVSGNPSTNVPPFPTAYSSGPLKNAPHYFLGWWFNADNEVLDNGWFQSQMNIGLEADDDTDLWYEITYSPQNPNPSTTYSYTASSSFSINFTPSIFENGGSPGGGSYSSQDTNSKTYTISDWNLTDVSNPGGANNFAWSFYSQNPNMLDTGSTPTWWENDSFWNGKGYLPNIWILNDLNTSDLTVGASGVWQVLPTCTTDSSGNRTCELQTGTIEFQEISATQYLAEIFCDTLNTDPGDTAYTCSHGYGPDGPNQPDNFPVRGFNPWLQTYSQSVDIDLDMVNPVIPVENSFTFSDINGNPINTTNPTEAPFAGSCIQATFDLSGPTPFEYTSIGAMIDGNGNNPNASVADSEVNIPDNSSQGSFWIETNANGLTTAGEALEITVSVESIGQTINGQFPLQYVEGMAPQSCPSSS